jgi:serine/threonine protein kinase
MGSNTSPHEVFGPYIVFERLGVGGMATVHRAIKAGVAGFERVCALKRLLPHLAEDPTFVNAFVREAKLAGHLQHGSIAHIYELGRVGASYYMAMEYVEGFDLRKVLRQAARTAGTPPIPVVLTILTELCDALDHAHLRRDDTTDEPLGIVHRDVSPSNVIVTPSGHTKVIDFGIAKAEAIALKTDTGRVKGKLGYMSPEAVGGGDLDARSDLFSAGVISYELLTARPLFSRKNDYDTLTRVRSMDVPPPSTMNPAVPPELDAIILRALAKDRDARWPSAASMREALHRVALADELVPHNRVVSGWIQWAFSLPTRPRHRTTTSSEFSVWRPPSGVEAIPQGDSELPPAEADDHVVEIAWGGRDAAAAALAPGVPDVSDQLPLVAAPAPGLELDNDGIAHTPSPRRVDPPPLAAPAEVVLRDEPPPAFLLPRISFRSRKTGLQAMLDQPVKARPPVADMPFIVWKSGAVWDSLRAPKRPPALPRGTVPPPFGEPATATTHAPPRTARAFDRVSVRVHGTTPPQDDPGEVNAAGSDQLADTADRAEACAEPLVSTKLIDPLERPRFDVARGTTPPPALVAPAVDADGYPTSRVRARPPTRTSRETERELSIIEHAPEPTQPRAELRKRAPTAPLAPSRRASDPTTLLIATLAALAGFVLAVLLLR